MSNTPTDSTATTIQSAPSWPVWVVLIAMIALGLWFWGQSCATARTTAKAKAEAAAAEYATTHPAPVAPEHTAPAAVTEFGYHPFGADGCVVAGLYSPANFNGVGGDGNIVAHAPGSHSTPITLDGRASAPRTEFGAAYGPWRFCRPAGGSETGVMVTPK